MSASRTNNNRKRRRHGVDDNKSLYSPGTSLRQYFGEQMHMSSPYKPPRIDRPIHTYCNSNDPTLINLHVCGIPIKLPVKPYRSQMAMFDRIMKGLVRQQNCLIESPTGTGKTLALLSAALAWLETERERTLQESLSRKASCPVHSFPATIVDTQSTPVSSQDDPDEAFVSRHTPLSALKKFAYDPSFVSTSPQCTCSEPERIPTIIKLSCNAVAEIQQNPIFI